VLSFDPLTDWHLVRASISMADAPGGVEHCEIRVADTPLRVEMRRSDLWVVDGMHVAPLSEVIAGGGGGSFEVGGGATSVGFDELCIGAVPEDCGWSTGPIPDAGVDAAADAGVDAAADAAIDTGSGVGGGEPPVSFRGGGGCECDASGDPAGSMIFVALPLLVLVRRSRRRREATERG
jgi:uncharacterized protein (TIGR03382 family)